VKIDDLKQLVAQHVAGDQLTLPADTLGDAAGGVLTNWLGGTLSLTKATTPTQDGLTVTVTGVLKDLGAAPDQDTTVTFTVVDAAGAPSEDGVPAITVSIPLSTGWDFGKGFPAAANSAVATLLRFPAGAVVVLTSVPLDASDTMPALEAGEAGFAATEVGGAGNLAGFVDLVADGGTPRLSGVLGAAAAKLQFALTTPPVPAGKFGAKFWLDVTTASDNGTTEHQVRLLADVNVPGVEKAVRLSATVGTGPAQPLFLTVGSPIQASQCPWSDLSTWTGDDLTQSTSSGFPLGDLVTVQSVWVALSPGKTLGGVVAEVGVQVGVTTTWKINDSFTVEQLWVAFAVTTPFTATRMVRAWAGGAARLGDDIDLKAEIVFTVGGGTTTADVSLQTQKPVQLDQLLRGTGLQLPDAPTVTLESVAFNLTLPALSFTITALSAVGPCQLGLGGPVIALTAVALDLSYDKATGLSGDFDAQAAITPPGGPGSVTFAARWDVGKQFALRGQLPDVSLTSLLESLATQLDYQSFSLPEITLRKATATATVATTKGTYGLTISGDVDFGETDVRIGAYAGKTATGTAFAGALEVTDWMPPVLKDLNVLTIAKAGVVLCTDQVTRDFLPEGVTLPSSLPNELRKGVTFFADVTFQGAVKDALTALFGEPGDLTVAGTLAVPLTGSHFTVYFGNRNIKAGGLGFTGLVLDINLMNRTFDLRAKFVASFTIPDGKPETLSFAIGGALTLAATPALSLYFLLAADDCQQDLQGKLSGARQLPAVERAAWHEPFGIRGLDILDFFGEFTLDANGVAVGMGGAVRIGTANSYVALSLSVEGGYVDGAPFVDVFILDIDASTTPKHEITLGDLVRQFVHQDNNDWLTLLDEFALSEFHLAIVTKVGGWTDLKTKVLYQQGFSTRGKLELFGNVFTFDIRIVTTKGIDAKGDVADPIVLADGAFRLSDSTGKAGPHAAICTMVDIGTKDIVSLSASLTLLAITTTIDAKANTTGWTFTWETKVGDVFDIKMASTLGKEGFSGTFGLKLDLASITTTAGGIDAFPLGTVIKNLKVNVTVALGITLSDVTLRLEGQAGIGTQTIGVKFSLDSLRDWNKLPDEIEKFAASFPEQLFKDLLDDVEAWAKAVGEQVINVGDKVATILKNYFKVTAEAAAQLLKAAGVGAEDAVKYLTDLWDAGEGAMVDALKKYWNYTEDEAEKLISALGKACAVRSGAKQA
jgi:hypothetical protein